MPDQDPYHDASQYIKALEVDIADKYVKRRTSPLSASDATRYATIQASVTAVRSHLISPDAWWQLFQHLETAGLFLAYEKYKLSIRARGLEKMLNLLQAQQACGPDPHRNRAFINLWLTMASLQMAGQMAMYASRTYEIIWAFGSPPLPEVLWALARHFGTSEVKDARRAMDFLRQGLKLKVITLHEVDTHVKQTYWPSLDLNALLACEDEDSMDCQSEEETVTTSTALATPLSTSLSRQGLMYPSTPRGMLKTHDPSSASAHLVTSSSMMPQRVLVHQQKEVMEQEEDVDLMHRYTLTSTSSSTPDNHRYNHHNTSSNPLPIPRWTPSLPSVAASVTPASSRRSSSTSSSSSSSSSSMSFKHPGRPSFPQDDSQRMVGGHGSGHGSGARDRTTGSTSSSDEGSCLVSMSGGDASSHHHHHHSLSSTGHIDTSQGSLPPLPRTPFTPLVVTPPAVSSFSSFSSAFSSKDKENEGMMSEQLTRPLGRILHSSSVSTPGPPHHPKKSHNFVPATTPHSHGSHITIGQVQYTKLEEIGRGGSSKVFRLLGPDFKVYALKKIKLKTMDKASIAQYDNEIAVLKRLQGNPYIIRLIAHETDVANHVIYVVMEYGEMDLHQKIQEYRLESGTQMMDVNQIRLTWKNMLNAVEAIHQARIVHGDLKPANFIFVNGNLKLIDFGIAKVIANDTTNIVREGHVGTINYMSPEAIIATNPATGLPQVTNSHAMKVSRASDIWSLGCILYQMAYGKPPFAQFTTMISKLQAIINRKFVIPFPPLDNPYLQATIQKCLSRDLSKRATIQGPKGLLTDAFLLPPGSSTAASALAKTRQPPAIPAVTLTLPQLSQLVTEVLKFSSAANMQGVQVNNEKLAQKAFEQLQLSSTSATTSPLRLSVRDF